VTNETRNYEHRDYTWKSLGLLIAASLLTVWLLHQIFGEKEEVIRAWDFRRLDIGDWEWRCLAENAESTPEGATFLMHKPGPGLIIEGLDVDTSVVGQVRVHVRVVDLTSGRQLVPRPELYWARDEDLQQAQGQWPFHTTRGCNFDLLDRHQPDAYTAQPAMWKIWEGRKWESTVRSIFIGFAFRSPSEEGYRITISRIEFQRLPPKRW
jgi:hypothetical protein